MACLDIITIENITKSRNVLIEPIDCFRLEDLPISKHPQIDREKPELSGLEPFVSKRRIDTRSQLGELDSSVGVLEHFLHVAVQLEVTTHQAVDDA